MPEIIDNKARVKINPVIKVLTELCDFDDYRGRSEYNEFQCY